MWSVAVRWAVGGKKGKKKSRPFHAEPRSFTDARHSSIGFPLESSGPSSGTRDDNHNRETARISAPFVPIRPSRSTPNFASFLLFLSFYFSFFPNRKNARKGRTRNESTKSWASLLRIFSPFENREGMVRVAKRRLLLSARTFLSLPSILA